MSPVSRCHRSSLAYRSRLTSWLPGVPKALQIRHAEPGVLVGANGARIALVHNCYFHLAGRDAKASPILHRLEEPRGPVRDFARPPHGLLAPVRTLGRAFLCIPVMYSGLPVSAQLPDRHHPERAAMRLSHLRRNHQRDFRASPNCCAFSKRSRARPSLNLAFRQAWSPLHLVAMDVVVRLAVETPVSNRWGQGNRLAVERHLPIGWVQRSDDLIPTSAAAPMHSRSEGY